jgi:protein-tyrosine phosphatase
VWISKLFKKESSESSLSWLVADMHSHLVPGIDDGSPDLETSIELVKGFQQLGFKKIVTSPHILWEMYPNTPETIHTGLATLRAEIEKLGMEVEVRACAEYFIDEHFVEELQQKKPLLAIKDNMVLVEISTVTAPFDFKEVLFEMQMQNYQPVIAHPERYIYLRNNKSIFRDLKDAGCLLQLNLLSLIGHYGVSVQELAEYLIKEELYDFVGTDLHHAKHLPLLQKAAGASHLLRLRDSGRIRNAGL